MTSWWNLGKSDPTEMDDKQLRKNNAHDNYTKVEKCSICLEITGFFFCSSILLFSYCLTFSDIQQECLLV